MSFLKVIPGCCVFLFHSNSSCEQLGVRRYCRRSAGLIGMARHAYWWCSLSLHKWTWKLSGASCAEPVMGVAQRLAQKLWQHW